jgi:hypothetical protein
MCMQRFQKGYFIAMHRHALFVCVCMHMMRTHMRTNHPQARVQEQKCKMTGFCPCERHYLSACMHIHMCMHAHTHAYAEAYTCMYMQDRDE